MKLQKRLNRRVGEKRYDRYIVTLSTADVEKLGWKDNQELDGEISDNTLTLVPKSGHTGTKKRDR